MREIKFRGIRLFDKKWIYGNLIQDKHGNKYIVPLDYFELDGHHLYCASDDPCFIIEDSIGEYTGLKDKNGKDIYEGDIVKRPDSETIFIIVFNEGSFCVQDYENLHYNLGLLDGVSSFFNVIGNIYEKKELLK